MIKNRSPQLIIIGIALAILVGCGGGQQALSNAADESTVSPTPDSTAAVVAEQKNNSPTETEPTSTIVPVSTQVTPTPNTIITAPSSTPGLGSSNPCEDLTGSYKDLCEQMSKPGTGSQHGPDANMRMPNPCKEFTGDIKTRCEEEIAKDPAFGGTGSGYVQNFDPNNIPKVAEFNFSELDKLGRTSKFRSVSGHDFSFNTSEYDPSGTNCRSMKHYMVPFGAPRENAKYSTAPHTFRWMTLKFFAPANGIIGNVIHSESHGEPESQFTVGSTEHPGYYFGFYHVKLAPGLGNGSEVKAGQQIGTLGNEESWAEISVEARINSREIHLFSFLEVATEEVLEQYKERGVNMVSDVIITKEERDANPIGCDRNSEAGWFEGSYKYNASEAFMTWVFESSENWFFFN
jgi:hypothetical protein